MSYLLTQILVCLLIAGLIGAVIGWFLRGGCSKKLRDCEDEWKMKVGSLESEWSTKLQRTEDSSDNLSNKELQAATLKRHTQHIETETPSYSYDEELRKKLQIDKEETTIGIPNSDNFDPSIFQGILANRGIKLSDEKIKLYSEQGIDFENTTNLEDDYDVQTIEGIGPKYAQALKDMGIPTTQALVTKLMKNHDGIDQIAKTLKIQPEALSSWISMADLVQLPGVDAQAAELMQTVGIESAKELAITNANSLHSEMVAFNKKSPIVPEVPSAESLGLWSKIAKLLG